MLSIVMMIFRSSVLILWANTDHHSPNIFEMNNRNAITYAVILAVDILIFVGLTIMFAGNTRRRTISAENT